MESLPEKSVGGGLRRRGIPTFPANMGHSALFLASGRGPIVPKGSPGGTGCVGGQVGGSGRLDKGPDLHNPTGVSRLLGRGAAPWGSTRKAAREGRFVQPRSSGFRKH